MNTYHVKPICVETVIDWRGARVRIYTISAAGRSLYCAFDFMEAQRFCNALRLCGWPGGSYVRPEKYQKEEWTPLSIPPKKPSRRASA